MNTGNIFISFWRCSNCSDIIFQEMFIFYFFFSSFSSFSSFSFCAFLTLSLSLYDFHNVHFSHAHLSNLHTTSHSYKVLVSSVLHICRGNLGRLSPPGKMLYFPWPGASPRGA